MGNHISKYDDEFKKSLVSMYQNGKSLTQIAREYGVSLSALSRWVKLFSEVKLDDQTIMNALLEEENLILKKAIAIFTPHSANA